MTDAFSPRLDILPRPQRRLWDELGNIPRGFVLYGGTAVALHLGHRHSVEQFNPKKRSSDGNGGALR